MADELNTQSVLAEISSGLGFNADTNSDVEETVAGGQGGDSLEASGGADTIEGATGGSGAGTEGSPTPPAPPPGGAPKSWRAEAAAAFATLPPHVQAEVLKREDDFHRGLESYKAAAGFGQNMFKAVEKYLPILRQYNIDPAAQVAGLMNSHHTLAVGSPDQKVGLMLKLVRDYQIDLGAVVRAADPANAPYVAPEVQALTQTVQTLQSRLAQQDQHRIAQIQTELGTSIDSFARNPKNVYFNDVANDMAQLIQTGASTTLEDAYEKAVWMNPATRAKEASRLAAEQAEKARQAAAARTAAARNAAGANVSARAKNGSATAPVGSLDDTLREAYRKINPA